MKKAYIGIDTEIPIYETQNKTITVNTSNIGDVFEVANGNYYFKGSGSTFTTTNTSVASSTATTTLTAKTDMSVSFTYSYSSEYNYDKLTIKVAGNTVADALSGVTEVRTYSGSLKTGQTIEFTYTKDGSQNANDDQCKFYNMSVTGNIKTQVGTETKCVAREIKKGYIGIPTFEKRTLPNGYTQLEYIESSGTQYIDTGFKPNQDTRVVAEIAFLGTLGQNVAGVRKSTSDTTNRFGIVSISSSSKLGAFFGTSLTQGVSFDSNKHKYELSAAGLTIDSTSYGGANTGTFSCGFNFVLFGWSDGGTVTKTNSRVYFCQMYDNGTLVRDFIPCKNSSGIVGLYDTVNGKFYKNAGTGTFTVGDEYKQVARKIKKAYIGIGGVARPCWSGSGTVAYWGQITSLPYISNNWAATNNKNYAVYSVPEHSKYTAYNSDLTQKNGTMDYPYWYRRGESIGNYAVFYGGLYWDDYGDWAVDRIVTVNNSLSVSYSTAPYGAYNYGSAHTTNYALFAGGQNLSSTLNKVLSVNASLTQTTLSATLPKTAKDLVGVSTQGCAFFGGSSMFVAINDNLTITTLTTPSNAGRTDHFGASAGKYAMFVGGVANSNYLNSTIAYDENLTLVDTTSATLGQARSLGVGVTLGEFAIFAGGSTTGNVNSSFVDVYDSSLTRSNEITVTPARRRGVTATIGSYALIGGGSVTYSNNSNASTNEVYTFKLLE